MSKFDIVVKPVMLVGGLALACAVIVEIGVAGRPEPLSIAIWTVLGASVGLIIGLYRLAQERRRRAEIRARKAAMRAPRD